MKHNGFSLIEVLLVIGIIGALTGMAIPAYRDYQVRSDLNLATEQVTQGLARAKVLSQSGKEDTGWGFYIPSGTLYKGDNYAERDTSYDETYPMPSTITMNGIEEISYSKLDGIPSSTGAITLTALNNETRNVLISVAKESVAIVESDELIICHRPPGNPDNAQTITIGDNAWPAHRDNHGDTLGPCSGGASSSVAPQSSVSSSQSSSAVTSSSSQSGGGTSCQNRFSVDADGTITVAGSLSVQFDSLGAAFKYGDNGPDVPVYVSYKNKRNGNNWKDLFNGDGINGDGGETQTVSGIKTGDVVLLRFNAYYRRNRWLSYDRTVYSNDTSDAVLILRNGDTVPTIEGADGQVGVSELLEPVTVDGRISIGTYDLLMITDFNRLDCNENSCSNQYCSNCDGVDYQDGIVLVRFLEPAC